MAAIVVDRGLQVIGGRASSTGDAFAAIQAMAVDDSVTAFDAGDTSLGSPTTEADSNFDSTPTRSAEEVSHVATFGTGVVLTIRRISLHNAAAASVTGSSTTLVAGIDAQALTKTADFTLTLTVKISYTRP